MMPDKAWRKVSIFVGPDGQPESGNVEWFDEIWRPLESVTVGFGPFDGFDEAIKVLMDQKMRSHLDEQMTLL